MKTEKRYVDVVKVVKENTIAYRDVFVCADGYTTQTWDVAIEHDRRLLFGERSVQDIEKLQDSVKSSSGSAFAIDGPASFYYFNNFDEVLLVTDEFTIPESAINIIPGWYLVEYCVVDDDSDCDYVNIIPVNDLVKDLKLGIAQLPEGITL